MVGPGEGQMEALRRLGRFPAYVVRRFLSDDALRVASALAYTSLLSVVPLLAIALAMLAAFPVFRDVREQLQAFIFENFAPDISEALQTYITQFVRNAGELTAVGVIGLAVTAILLLFTVETALNQIFRVEKPRPLSSRVFLYWTALTLGPLLLGASFSLSGYLMAVGRWVEQEGITGTRQFVSQLLPTVLVVLSFALLYFAVPNRKVRVGDALIGGIFAGGLFAVLRFGFGIYVANARLYESIYGALSALPLFLVWIFLSWAVILLGAELTAALPEWRSGRRIVAQHLPPRRRLALAMDVLAVLHQAALHGTAGVGRRVLLLRTAADEASLRTVIELLRKGGFVAGAGGERYLLSRDLEAATLYDLVRVLDLALGMGEAEGREQAWRERVQALIDDADAREREIFGVSVRSLLHDGRIFEGTEEVETGDDEGDPDVDDLSGGGSVPPVP